MKKYEVLQLSGSFDMETALNQRSEKYGEIHIEKMSTSQIDDYIITTVIVSYDPAQEMTRQEIGKTVMNSMSSLPYPTKSY